MLLTLLVSGLATGSIYALVGIGLVQIFKAARVKNFAQGDMFMLGAFLSFTLHVLLGFPYLAALLVATIGTTVLGLLTERVAYRPISKSSIISLMMSTVASGFILRGFARVIWGGKGDFLTFPPILGSEPISLGNVVISSQHLVLLGASLITMGIFGAIFKYTEIGKMMRAAADNKRAAQLVGIEIGKISAITWALAGCLGGVAGVLMAPIRLIYPDMGLHILLRALAAVTVGGFDSVLGAVVGGMLVGILENLVSGYISSQLMDVSAFVIIVLVLLVRPYGLFGTPEIRKV